MNLSQMGISAITFDLDDTLWPCAPVLRHAETVYHDWLQAHCPAAVIQYSSDELRAKRTQLLESFPQLRNDVSEWRLRATRELLAEFGVDEGRAEEAFSAFLGARQQVCFYDDVMSGLQDLSFHYRLGALTNGNADLQRIGVNQLFDSALYATLELPAKPAPDMFLQACEELGVAPASLLHVGDNAYTDIEGARLVGCKTAWMNRTDLVYPDDVEPADLDICSVADLVALAPDILRKEPR